MEKSRMMTKEKYESLKTDSAQNQLRSLHKIFRNVGETIDDSVQQMTMAMDISNVFLKWMEKWMSQDAITDDELSDAKKLVAQTTAVLSGLQSMSAIFDKLWMKSRTFDMPPEIPGESLDD